MVKTPSIKKMGLNYITIKKQLLKSYKFMESVKFGFSVFFLVLAFGLYGYFVNISSTKGYFIRQEREKLSEVKFQNEIVKINVRKMESKILNSILPDTILNDNNFTGNIVYINNLDEVTYKD